MPKRKTVIREIDRTHVEIVRLYSEYCKTGLVEDSDDLRAMSRMIEEVRKLRERFMSPVEIQEELESGDD